MIGANKLGEFAERLENAGKLGNFRTIEMELGTLLNKYKELVRKL